MNGSRQSICPNLAFLLDFDTLFPTEIHCMYELLRKLPARACCACGSKSISRRLNLRQDVCQDCGHGRSITAGTFFHGMKKARPWLAAMMMFEEGLQFSISELHRLLDIAFSTAWSIFQKLSAVIDHALSVEESPETQQIGKFREIITRRSSLTPAKQHPVAELVDDFDEGQDALVNCDSSAVDLAPVEENVLSFLSSEPSSFSSLCDKTGIFVGTLTGILMKLQLDGLIVSPYVDYYRLATKQEQSSLNQAGGIDGAATSEMESVAQLVKTELIYLSNLHCGLSRKYLQRYIATAWFHFDRTRWVTGALVGLCVMWGRFVHTDIETFVSAQMVHIGTTKMAEKIKNDFGSGHWEMY